MCVSAVRLVSVCRVGPPEEMWVSNSECRGVGWEVATGGSGTRALFLGG